jgi:adenylate cyclase
VHQGEVVAEGDDLLGDGVIIAARLEPLAEPGGICISARVREDAIGKFPLHVEDLGEPELKNIAQRHRVFRVHLDQLERPTRALPDKPSIAVLPFANLSSDPEQEYFADGMVEEITTALAKVRWLLVVARNSSFTYKGRATDVRDVGHALGVRYVLEGSVRRSAERVRITAQLIDALTGAHIWAERFDEEPENVLELQDRIAHKVAGQLQPELMAIEIARANRRQVQSLGAYDLYLRALGRFHKVTPPEVREAITLLREALTLDPAYAAALLCECRVLSATLAGTVLSVEERAESMELAKLAMNLGKDDPDTLCWASIALSTFGREHAIAEAQIDHALALNPSSAIGWETKGWVNCYRDRNDVALAAFNRALELSPLDPLRGFFNSGIARASLHVRKFEEASYCASRAFAELPELLGPMHVMVAACAHMGDHKEARKWLAKVLERQSGLTIRAWRARTIFTGSGRDVAEVGLRMAGLPES